MCQVRYRKRKHKNGRRIGKAQVSLEIAIALVSVFIILLGAFNLFLWLNQRFIQRQQDYERTRVQAGSSADNSEIQVDELRYPKLNILKND